MSGKDDLNTLDESLVAPGTNNSGAQVYYLGDSQLIEVEVDDTAPDDASDAWTDVGDNVAAADEDDALAEAFERAPDVEAVDMAVATFKAHTDCVYSAAIHPTLSNTILTGGGDDVAYLWTYKVTETESGRPEITSTHRLAGHKDTVTSVGFNFDGTLCLTGSYDGKVCVWKVSDGSLLQTLEGPEDVEFAYWHNKGNAIIAGSKDGTIWMWLAHSGQCVQVFAGHDGAVTCGGFSQDGKWVLSGGEDGSVRVWAPKTGLCRVTFDGAVGHDATVTCVASSSDGDLLLSGSADGTMKLYQISGKRLLQTFKHSRPHEDENVVGESSFSNNNTSMKPIKEAASEDADGEADDEGNWEDADGEEAEGDGVECVGFSAPEFKWVASGGMDKTVKIWDLTTGSCRSICSHEAGVVSLHWHAHRPVVVSASLDRSIRIWDARSGSLWTELTGHTNLVTNFALRSFDAIGALPSAPSTTTAAAAPEPPSAAAEANVSSSARAVGGGSGVSGGGSGLDVIVSVSDDFTAKVFHLNISAFE